MIQVGVVMGSSSDWEVMRRGPSTQGTFGIEFECKVVSAHRTRGARLWAQKPRMNAVADPMVCASWVVRVIPLSATALM